MRKLLGLILALVIGLGLYLTLAPVPIDPVAWDAPEDRGYVGVFAPNDVLADVERLELGEAGPEDVAVRGGRLFASSHGGLILSRDLATGVVREVADTQGTPLGIEFDRAGRLLVADAARGLLRVDVETGSVKVLADSVDGTAIRYADDVDEAPDGRIWFTDASTRFGAQDHGTIEASLLEIIEHRGTGRVLVHDPRDGSTRVAADGLVFPNGIAVTADGQSVLVNITGDYLTLRIPVDGGAPTVFADNYPGFPDNINPGPEVGGEPTYIVGLVSPRSKELDGLSSRPFLRKVVQRLPEALKPAASDYPHMVVLGGDGRVLASWQDPAGGFGQSTGGVVAGNGLYMSSLTETAVGRVAVPVLN